MTEQKQDWFDRLIVPDVLREHPVPVWRQALPESGSRLRRLGRLAWRAYRFSQTGRKSADLPGPAYDMVVLVLAITSVVAWLLT